jgi:arabinogalactan endo-1,4-beta-galactosidase
MLKLPRHVAQRLLAGRASARRAARRRPGSLGRAAAVLAVPAALVLVAGAGAAVAGSAGGTAAPSPFPGHHVGPSFGHGSVARTRGHAVSTAAAVAAANRMTRQNAARPRDGWPPPSTPSINWALSGQATADSSETGDPASNAIDGDAGTDWCPNSWEGTLTVDLGQVRALDGIGITLDAASPSADATIQLGSSSGQWTTVRSATNLALDPGNPMYLPLPWNTTARYAQINVKSGTGAPVCVGEFRLFGPDRAAGQMALGADLSFTPQELAAGAQFTDRSRPGNPVEIMRDNGANWVRMRLWVNPPAGYSDLASDLALARAVHAAGMKIYLDIMYSDFWADPTQQNIPAAWQGQDLAQLTQTVQSYTQQVISAFAQQGTPVDMVSIGNEIRNGILWPIGEVDWTTNTGWDNLAQLLKAGVAGAEAANPPGHRLLIMMHFDQGGNNQLSQEFYQNLENLGVPFDVIGLSYYPFFHGPISAMRANVDALATEFHKPIVIAETQYAWTLANGNEQPGDSTGDFVWQPSQLSAGYPASPGGQLSFLSDELSILAQVPDGLGMGMFYWAPDWIPGVPWEPGAGIGSPNVNLTLFDFQGTALPSIGLFEDPVQVCASYDPWNVPCVIGG